jgi:hypothetical protein
MRETFKESLPCQLTSQEKLIKGEELVKRLEEKEELEDRKKTAADDFKSAIGVKEFDVKKLARQIGTGIEHREIECRELFHFARNLVETIRLDTGEVIRSRAMRPEERQAGLEYESDDDDTNASKSH